MDLIFFVFAAPIQNKQKTPRPNIQLFFLLCAKAVNSCAFPHQGRQKKGKNLILQPNIFTPLSFDCSTGKKHIHISYENY